MKIENNRVYINGLLEPLISEHVKKYKAYNNKMIQINESSQSYYVDNNGIEDRESNEEKLNIFEQVDLFDNKKSSNNITDLFSLLHYDNKDNVTTYNHYSTIKNLHFCPDILGLLDLKKSYKPLALQNISKKSYVDIYEKQTKLLNILSH